MKKVIAVILSLCFALLCGCSKSGNINNISVDYGESEIYSQQDMDSAIDVIKEQFSLWEGCKLHSITFAGDDICINNIGYCNELQRNGGYDECIVFNSSFHSPRYGGGAWSANTEYGWSWYLARKDNGAWTLLTYGYG